MKPIKLSPFMKELAGITKNRLDLFDPIRVENICDLGKAILTATMFRAFATALFSILIAVPVCMVCFPVMYFLAGYSDVIIGALAFIGYVVVVAILSVTVAEFSEKAYLERRNRKRKEFFKKVREFWGLSEDEPVYLYHEEKYLQSLKNYGLMDWIRDRAKKICIPVEQD